VQVSLRPFHPKTQPRTSIVYVGGQTFALTQNPTVINSNVTLSLSRQSLNFAVSGIVVTSTQTIAVSFTNGSAVTWTASSNQPNITVSPTSGVGNGTFQISATAGSSGIVSVIAVGVIKLTHHNSSR
jgi:hypothetical protein